MNKYSTARYLTKVFHAHLHAVTLKARSGSNSAAKELLHGVAAHHNAMHALGYTTNDSGVVIKLPKPTKAELAEKALVSGARAGKTSAIDALIKSWSKDIPEL